MAVSATALTLLANKWLSLPTPAAIASGAGVLGVSSLYFAAKHGEIKARFVAASAALALATGVTVETQKPFFDRMVDEITPDTLAERLTKLQQQCDLALGTSKQDIRDKKGQLHVNIPCPGLKS
ncbi:MAG: hypothetical protein DI551_06560 [Micavibrio aeruginosavorus]|uniref:Uncharacterized protein n=1 Tax=Micavibrio aeruginosavorus TaxID=349221 RepID=A0A2W5PM74_9BACT|nr:MAG: hypothetical protein DI551_06560 [Micavibrio aeruginosavorus]